jgi:[phosphatase 2A protein]-leucine-carboxy methyltransferase
MSSNDDSVRATNTSATECKACAVKLGYYDDPYVKYFVHANQGNLGYAIMRGYYFGRD